MKTLALIQFWSFLFFGLLFIFAATYLVASGRGSEALRNLLFIGGTGQLVWFFAILYFGKRPGRKN